MKYQRDRRHVEDCVHLSAKFYDTVGFMVKMSGAEMM